MRRHLRELGVFVLGAMPLHHAVRWSLFVRHVDFKNVRGKRKRQVCVREFQSVKRNVRDRDMWRSSNPARRESDYATYLDVTAFRRLSRL